MPGNSLRYLLLFSFGLIGMTSCFNYRKLITDEVVLKDENSITGTILKTDSAKIRLEKADESISIIQWADVDTVVGKKLKTLWFGANLGYYNTPYFSVFRNEAITGHAMGSQYKIGMATRGRNLYYLHFTFSPAKPYGISKFGIGYQWYLGKTTYLKKNSFFMGAELNLMNAKYNNGAQTTLEPFTGFERKLSEQIRVHFKFGLQLNVANKNNNLGSNFSVGFHFMRKNFKKCYDVLNKEHRLYRK